MHLYQKCLLILLALQPNAVLADDGGIYSLPSIPLLAIETDGRVMPSCTIVHAPEGCSGTSIDNNDYVAGRMIMTLGGDTLYDSGPFIPKTAGMRIKIRGNSTGAFMQQHPYKLKLSVKSDLFQRQLQSYSHKDWLLLGMYTWNPAMSNSESNILNFVGTAVSKAVGLEWTPEFRLVNVILNGHYEGLYYLMESVSRGDARVKIDDRGFIIEHDTFWWNEELYFKTSHQGQLMGFTFKYPDENDIDESILNRICNYIEYFEDVLYSEGDIGQIADMESFARWILVHDILGTDDAGGCNRFFYKSSIDDDSMLKMGPVWDFDSAFKSSGWSAMHTIGWFYFQRLFKRNDFISIYTDLWKKHRNSILYDIDLTLKVAEEYYGNVFDQAMACHRNAFPGEGAQPFAIQMREVRTKLSERILLLDRLMSEFESSSVKSNRQSTKVSPATLGSYDILGRPISHSFTNHRGFYVIRCQKILLH